MQTDYVQCTVNQASKVHLNVHVSFIFYHFSCIEKWLKGQGGKCPQCNCKAKRQDIRVLYAKSLKVRCKTLN